MNARVDKESVLQDANADNENVQEFFVKAELFTYEEGKGYSSDRIVVTSKAQMHKILGTSETRNVYSVVLGEEGGDTVLFANSLADAEIGHMTANSRDYTGDLFFFGGSFILCAFSDSTTITDITDSAVKKALSCISSKYISSELKEKYE